MLAAGIGTRMRPLTNTIPKAMLPLWGKPMIGHTIDLLVDWGVREILVNVHHCPDPLVKHLLEKETDRPARSLPPGGRAGGLKINLSFESKILGTGGALKRAARFIDDAPFWIINTDVAADVSPRPFLSELRSHNPIAVLWLHDKAGPRTVEMERGLITNFRSARPRTADTYTFCGLQLATPALLHYLPRQDVFSLVDLYENAMAAGERVHGVTVPGAYWSDVGTPERYLEAHADVFQRHKRGKAGGRMLKRTATVGRTSLRQRGITVNGFAAVSKDADVGTATGISNSVVWDGARIAPRTQLSNAIVAANASVSGDVSGIALPCTQLDQSDPIRRALRHMGWKMGTTTAILLGGRGSDRSFTRLIGKSKSVIFVQYGKVRPENARYTSHAGFLFEEGVPVPRIISDHPSRRTMIMEYIDGPSLESLAADSSGKTIEAIYRKALDSLLVMHHIPLSHLMARKVRLEPPFSTELYAWERKLFADHFLRGYPGLSGRNTRGIMSDLESVSDLLAKVPSVLIHRDMQSSNILWRREEPVFIDFQGMRLGPAAYDLASLLCDPYVMLPHACQSRLLEYYAGRNEPAHVKDIFWFAAVQRLAQALGAYGRLSVVPETRRFRRYIRPGLIMMNRALVHLEGLIHLRSFVSTALADKQLSKRLS